MMINAIIQDIILLQECAYFLLFASYVVVLFDADADITKVIQCVVWI